MDARYARASGGVELLERCYNIRMGSIVQKIQRLFPVVATVGLFVAAFFLLNYGFEPSDCTAENAHGEFHEVVFSASGAVPPCLQVFSGEKVQWENRTESVVQVGADPHPEHTGNAELSGGAFVLTVPPGETRVVQLLRKGEFGYHDHFNPSAHGRVIVE